MGGQCTLLNEACAATRGAACKRFLSSVDALVDFQGLLHRKAPSTNVTDIRLFARVGALVGDQGAAMRKACCTARIIAGVGFLAGVNAIVPGQVEWAHESLATPWMVAGVLPFLNSSLHRVRRRRRGHGRFCQSCRSHVRQQALLAVGGHCLQRGAGLHWSRNWWRWQQRIWRSVGGCWEWWELVLI